MKLGLFIGRLNPPHHGHLQTIQTALQENDELLLLLGTPNTQDEKNPFDFEQRKSLIQTVFPQKNIHILNLQDRPTDEEWCQNIIQHLEKIAPKNTHITFYGGDFQNDSAYKAIKNLEHFFTDYDLQYSELSRELSFIEYQGKKYELSATNFRKFLDEKNTDGAKHFTSPKIFQKIWELYEERK